MGSGIKLVGGNMDNIRIIGQLDTTACVVDLWKITRGNLWGLEVDCEEMTDSNMPHKTLILRCQKNWTRENWFDDLPMFDRPVLEKYDSFNALVAQAREKIAGDPIISKLINFSAPLGRMVISILKANSAMNWHIDRGPYAQEHLRFHIPLITNGSAMLYCGHQQGHIPTGVLTWLNVRQYHSAGNWGDFPRAHLIFEVRRNAGS